MAVTIRLICPRDVDLLRATRLRALEDAPTAFATTRDEAAERAPAAWEAQAAGRLGEHGSATYVAMSEDDGRVLGMAAGVRSEDTVEVLQVWVAPEHRGRGVLDGLLRVLREWGAPLVLETEVYEHNDRAVRAFKRRGFQVVAVEMADGHRVLRMRESTSREGPDTLAGCASASRDDGAHPAPR